MKKITTASLTLAILLLLAACGRDSDAADHLGEWELGAKLLTFKDNGSYTLKNDTTYSATGDYSVDGSEITLNDNASVCADSIKGAYAFSYKVVSSNGTFIPQLTITLAADACAERATLLPGTYSAVKKK